MLDKRVLFLFLLLTVAFTTLSLVSADESAGDVIANDSFDKMGISNNDLSQDDVEISDLDEDNEETLGSVDAGTFIALQDKISTATGSTIELENDYMYVDSDHDIVPTVTKSLTIDGKGHVIDGASKSALFRVLGKINVTLNNITFKNGYGSEVIRIDYANNIRIYNCNFVDNDGYFGGALVVTDTKYIEFNNTRFENNVGYLGGALFMNNTKNIFMFNNNFNNNSATFGGAFSLLNYNQTYIGGNKFAYNSASYGGAVCMESGNWSVVDGCTFAYNYANTGGAISLLDSLKTDIYVSIFTNNRASYGGAIKLDTSDDVYLMGNKFDNNMALFGGAIHITRVDSGVLGYCNFLKNSAEMLEDDGGVGGAIYAHDNRFLQFNYCDFQGNSAKSISGALSLYSCDAIIEDCNFTSNRGVLLGAVFVYESSAALHRCYFVKNSADASKDGISAVVGYGGDYGTFLIDCEFNGNTAPQIGGDVRMFYGVKLSVKQSGSTCDNKVITATLSKLYGSSVIANQIVTFRINGIDYDVKTNSKGQAILKLNLPAASYQVSIVHEGSGQYLTNSTSAFVVIKKATPKISASKKTFKKKTKTKKYSITLKNSVGKAIKNAIVKLTVKGKTYTAKTDGNGKATFKITKLNKKGSFPAVVKYAGSSRYYSVSKKVTIAVKK